MKTRKGVLGKEHPSTLISMANFAFALECLDCYDKAIFIDGDMLSVAETSLGSQHLYTARSLEALHERQPEHKLYFKANHVVDRWVRK
ncbi:hypothetical protein GQ44DRAFT_147079 [Phaeosphaeriaceae sp. PMI808]|nr:hypothetical protein GQ44DRAFT_147079 [Phaeosphaeriaceae sp. PMI808]